MNRSKRVYFCRYQEAETVAGNVLHRATHLPPAALSKNKRKIFAIDTVF